jgi:hypothetical protein
MPKKSLDEFPEVIVSSLATTKKISRYLKEGKLRKLATRLYTKNLKDPPELIVKRNLWPIVGAYYPGALIADRTALENKPASDGSIFIISTKKRVVRLPGITIHPRRGHPPLSTDHPFMSSLFLASQARAFLENMRPSRTGKDHVSRTLSRHELEEQIETLLRHGGIERLNKLRDDTAQIAKQLSLEKERKRLDALVGSFLGTKSLKLTSQMGIARQFGYPYDPKRVELFLTLQSTLYNTAPVTRYAPTLDPSANSNLAFFEAYFSNFIEGTEFEIEEAYKIIFNHQIPPQRPADAHDILGTYQLVSNTQEMSQSPRDFDHFIDLLKSRHAIIMKGRPDKEPGRFKNIVNRAGTTIFVVPELVTGTLKKGFEIFEAVDIPLHRAIFMMFLVAEVHPFLDGNGRIARVMMNAELVASKEQRIIIPTVYRNNYLSALRALSLNGNAEALIRTLDFAQKYTANLNFQDFNHTLQQLEKTHAFMDPNEAEDRGLRLILPSRDL